MQLSKKEKQGFIKAGDLKILSDIIQNVTHDLVVEKILDFKNLNVAARYAGTSRQSIFNIANKKGVISNKRILNFAEIFLIDREFTKNEKRKGVRD